MAGEQLELPLSGTVPATEPTRIPRSKRVFANRSLKMAGIDWVGFDMDYTLAIYNQAEMDRLSIDATVRKLIARGYPEELASARSISRFAAFSSTRSTDTCSSSIDSSTCRRATTV